MGALRLTLRAELRRRWRPMLMLALLLGITGGVALTAAAGAVRTDTAYPRLLRWASAAQVNVIVKSAPVPAFFTALERLPGVAAASAEGLFNFTLPARHGPPTALVETYSSPDDSMGRTGDRLKMLAGQLPDPTRPATAVIDQNLAAREHLRPGGTLHLLMIPNTKGGIPDLRHVRDMSFRVSGIAVFDSQIVPATKVNAEPTVLLSSAFYHSAAAAKSTYGSRAGVRLRPGVSVASFARAAAALARRYPATRGVIVVSLQDEAAATQRAIRPQAVALAVFAALVALIALAVIGQLLSRQLSLDSAQYPVLNALGMSRAALAALSLARLALVTAAGAVLAVVIAIAASPLMPIGPARLAEPHPGVDVNLAVLGAGLALIAGLPLLVLAAAIWRNATRAAGPPGTADSAGPVGASRLGAALGRLGSVPGSIGVRMSFEAGHGQTAVPVRSALAGTIVAVTSVVAALVFGASLIHLVSTPRLYGQRWQQELDLGFGGVPGPLLSGILARQPDLASYAIGNYGEVTVQGAIVPAIGIAPVRGRNFLSLLAGRPPARPDEIALGAQTLKTLHRRLGQRIAVQVNGVTRPMLITGTAVFAAFSRGSFESTDLGNGAVLPAPVLSQPEPQTGCPRPRTCYSFALLRYRPGTDLRAAAARLTAATTRSGCPIGSCVVISDQRPDDIRNFSRVRDTPLVLGAVLALLAVGTLAHVLVTAVRRRRRDLAMLKTLGLVRRQVLSVVEWQALSLAGVALLVGVPLGLLAGRWAWVLFASSAGLAPAASVPIPLVLLTIPVTAALAAGIAVWPGRAAARVRPAVVLRTE
jgi:ABC-type antimicrobial peptide transport system permease subunit